MNPNSNQDKYLLRAKKQIVQTLRLLAKNKCIITASFNAGKSSFVTVVIDVLPDRNAVILDYGRDEAVNKKLLDIQQVTFIASYHGIDSRFSSDQILRKEFDGGTVFVVPIPDRLYWFEKREYYRVRTPLNVQASCKIPFETVDGDETQSLNVTNISITGMGLIEREDSLLSKSLGKRITGCQLLLPEHQGEVILEIRHRTPIATENESEDHTVGCAIISPDHHLQSKIMQFMRAIELQRKQVML